MALTDSKQLDRIENYLRFLVEAELQENDGRIVAYEPCVDLDKCLSRISKTGSRYVGGE